MRQVATATFEEISASDFFYRNRDIAVFTNPSRAIFAAIRELVENSLDAAESSKIPPEVYVRLSFEVRQRRKRRFTSYELRTTAAASNLVSYLSFRTGFYGSKYKLKQMRGTFGLGGKNGCALRANHTPPACFRYFKHWNSQIYQFKLMMDIQRNRPIILDRKVLINKEQWRGTIVDSPSKATTSGRCQR